MPDENEAALLCMTVLLMYYFTTCDPSAINQNVTFYEPTCLIHTYNCNLHIAAVHAQALFDVYS